MFDPGSGNCKAKKGLLVLRECGQPAVGVCGGCGLQICQVHQVIDPMKGAVLCPDCAARDQNYAPRGPVGRSRRRNTYYSHYHYMPFYYLGHGHDRDYFNGNDRAAVDAKAEQAGVAAGATADDAAGVGADQDEFDDFDSSES